MKHIPLWLAALGLAWTLAACGSSQPAASPTQVPVEVGPAPSEVPPTVAATAAAPSGAGMSYADPSGYSVTLPASWEGKVSPQPMPAADMAAIHPKAKAATQFMYQPTDPANKPAPILTLSVYTTDDWAVVSAEGGPPVGTAVGSFGDGMTLVASTPQDSPYPQGTADQQAFDKLYGDLKPENLMATAGTSSEGGSETPEVQANATDEPGSPLEPAVVLMPLPAGMEPVAGQEVGVPVMAADPDGVAKVELMINGVVVASTAWPNAQKFFEGAVNWKPKDPGSYEMVAVATDPEGHQSEVSRQTIVVAPPPPPAAPAATKRPAPTKAAVAATAAPDRSPPSVSIEPKSKKVAAGDKMVIFTNAVSPQGIVKLELHAGNKIRAVWNYDGPAGQAPKSAFQTLTWPNARAGPYDDVFVTAVTSTGGVNQSVKEKVSVK